MTFAEKYFSVFDANTGKIRNCGRDACISLIRACQDISPNTDFGNVDTGTTNELAIKTLAQKIGIIDILK